MNKEINKEMNKEMNTNLKEVVKISIKFRKITFFIKYQHCLINDYYT